MNKGKRIAVKWVILLSFFCLLAGPYYLSAQPQPQESKTVTLHGKIEAKVLQMMEKGDIPGLGLVIVRGDEPVYFKGFGYADKEKKIPVTPDTLFELGSCSKAFTALGALLLVEKGDISLDDRVSKYFPWFKASFEEKEYPITIRQLLHHTSGIPQTAIKYAVSGNSDDAIQQTMRNLSGIELEGRPGREFHYCTVNYTVVGAIIEKVSGMSFEKYMSEHVFKPLGLTGTRVGVDQSNPPPGMAKGYKVSFFAPRPYTAPVMRGNYPAGYVVSSGKDIARWLGLQLGEIDTPLAPLIDKTQQADRSVKPDPKSMSSYAMGWQVNQFSDDATFHTGLNPNFNTFIIFGREERTGVAVLTNSNSPIALQIGAHVVHLIFHENEEAPSEAVPENNIDKTSSVISYVLFFLLFVMLLYFLSILYQVIKGKRQFEGLSLKKIAKYLFMPLVFAPFLLAIYLVPQVIADATWELAFMWGPKSLQVAVVLIMVVMASVYILFIISSMFPQKNKYFKAMPSLLGISLVTGGANAMVIFLITTSLYAKVPLQYLLYYFGLTMVVYILGRKYVQTKMVGITLDLVYDMRMNLIGKIFYTSYQRFEKIEDGRIFAVLNNDTGQVSNAANVFVGLATSLITVVAIFMYLATIAFWATLVTVGVILVIIALYYSVGVNADKYFHKARDTQNVYMGLLNGMIDGFKELSLHFRKRMEYKDDLEKSCDQFRYSQRSALIKFVNAFLIGESLLILVLGTVGFIVPKVFPDIQTITLMSFIIALLYLIGPINVILNAVPNIIQMRIAWGRIQRFIRDVPANMDPEEVGKPLIIEKNEVNRVDASNLVFSYKAPETVPQPALGPGNEKKINASTNPKNNNLFTLGPLNFETNRGKLVFIVGGNGSGKTTLAKLLVGLYDSDGGSIKINDEEIPAHQLGEYFSCVFSDYHLFQKLYEINTAEKTEEIREKLELLKMDGRVEIKEDRFSTINLSGGQRKRLALFQSYLEDSPIYLFDEVAADQDPQFRKFFYRELLPKMRDEGKIVIAITHDDHYFDVADEVVKMDLGQIENIADGANYRVTN